MKRTMITLIIAFALPAFGNITIAAPTITSYSYVSNLVNTISGLLTTEPNIDLIVGPSEALGGADSNKARIKFVDSLGYLIPVPADTFYRSRVVVNALRTFMSLAATYGTTILPGTVWILDNYQRCYEAMAIIGPDGWIKRIRRKAHQAHKDVFVDGDIHLDTIETRDGSIYTYFLTISNESRDIPKIYGLCGTPADIWLLSARHWGNNFERIAFSIQNSCPPNWSLIATYFDSTKYKALLDSNWIKPSSPMVISVLWDTAGATVAGNLVGRYRPYDDWYVFSDYRLNSYGVIVSCDPTYPPRYRYGLVVFALDTMARPVRGLHVQYGPSGSPPTRSGYTDERGLFQFSICSPATYYLAFDKESCIVSIDDTTIYVPATVPRETIYVRVRRDPTISVAEQNLPERELLTVSPNPFNSSCEISAPSDAEVEILDLRGNIIGPPFVSTGSALVLLNQGGQNSSEARAQRVFVWTPGEKIPSGVYFVRAKTRDGITAMKRVVYLK